MIVPEIKGASSARPIPAAAVVVIGRRRCERGGGIVLVTCARIIAVSRGCLHYSSAAGRGGQPARSSRLSQESAPTHRSRRTAASRRGLARDRARVLSGGSRSV